ncbi:glycosyltransferase [Mycobacterium sp. CPCC 205372]|uniref:Glycosyltransferase n=1 Tax=Mycobacterium hippophais TaxID=3016340 RepID=A0ABT4PRR7_9MYCO|nr:glycosyltransferase [Mycobacterium hippophais]MCZ8379263.1 glycosyltransferase [Mycobacterium hippophais]
MRILHAVTLISPDGAYGGPLRVAINQATALRDLGHEVTVAAAARGFETLPTSQEGVPLVLRRARTLVPGTGFAGLTAPGLVQWLVRSRNHIDVVHVHFARDLVVIPLAAAARRLGIPFVLQPHGMVLPGTNRLAPAVDFLAGRRLLRAAREVYYLTNEERVALEEVGGGGVKLSPLPNGVPLYPEAFESGDDPEVLYLARLHPRKRPGDFVKAGLALNAEGVPAKYTMVGPDEGEAAAVTAAAAAADNIVWEGAIAAGSGPERMRRAAVYVLPSVGPEPYPMAVLEAMSVGLPVVITDECGLAPLVRDHHCGLVVAPGAESIAEALRTLLGDRVAAREMGRRGRAAVREELGMSAIGTLLEGRYSAAVSAVGGAR